MLHPVVKKKEAGVMQKWLLSADAVAFRMANRNPSFLLRILLTSLVLFTGCQNGNTSTATTENSSSSNGGRLKVVATVGMVADIVREIGGERIELAQLMGPGVDPHLY
jgi:manganese/zinc/iron transport system substrate-binding protein